MVQYEFDRLGWKNEDKIFTVTIIGGEQATLSETVEPDTVGVIVGLLIILTGLGLAWSSLV